MDVTAGSGPPADPRRGVDAGDSGQGAGRQPHQEDQPASSSVPPFLSGVATALHGPRPWLAGRDDDVAGLAALLEDTRVVTVTGPPGVGKTSVAVAAAHAAQQSGAHGYLLDLRTVSTSGLLESVPVPREDQRGDVPRLVVVLDGTDRDEAGSADLAERLLQLHQSMHVVSTGRRPLGLPEERVWRLSSLPAPDVGMDADLEALEQYPSVQLFGIRAKEVQAGFRLSADNAAEVAAICRRLEGNPLAIELAAFRLDAMTPAEVLAHLDDPLEFLRYRTARGWRSLADTVERSVSLLSDDERAILTRLSVFIGGFSLKAADDIGIGGDVPARSTAGLISGLVRASLVVADTSGPEARYRLPAPVRSYFGRLLERSGEARSVTERYAMWCLRVAETRSQHSPANLDRLRVESDNIRAAMDWAVSSGADELALRLACALPVFWDAPEVLGWLDRALAACTSSGVVKDRACAVKNAGYLACQLGEHDAARRHAEVCVALARDVGDDGLVAHTLTFLDFLSVLIDGPFIGVPLLEERVAVSRASGGQMLAITIAMCGRAYMHRGDAVTARVSFQELLDLADQLGDPELRMDALVSLGWAVSALGAYPEAERYLEQGKELGWQLDNRWGLAMCLLLLGEVALAAGDHVRSRLAFDEALSLAHQVGSRYHSLRSVLGLAACAQAAGGLAEAGSRLAEARAVAEGSRFTLLHAEISQGLARVAMADGDLAAAGDALKHALGIARNRGQDGVAGRVLHDLGTLARFLGDYGRSGTRYDEAIQQLWDLGDLPGSIDTLEALAGLAVAQGKADVAARLFGAGEAARQAGGYARSAAALPFYDLDVSQVAAMLPPGELEEVWSQGARLTPEHAVAYARRGRGERGRPASGWDSLTPAERSIVRLVAEGLGNNEIAERLFVSPRTVSSHLSRVFAKLKVSSRRELREVAQRKL